MSIDSTTPEREWVAHNYCVSFVDLLGQRDSMRGQGLLPPVQSKDQRAKFHEVLRSSIISIIKLQERAESMLSRMLRPNPNSPRRAALPPAEQATWDEMEQTRITTQRWSDGLMSFANLGDTDVKCRMNGVFGIFGLAGALCLMGLASGRPVRGAIEIAWGIELHTGELYGPAPPVSNYCETTSSS